MAKVRVAGARAAVGLVAEMAMVAVAGGKVELLVMAAEAERMEDPRAVVAAAQADACLAGEGVVPQVQTTQRPKRGRKARASWPGVVASCSWALRRVEAARRWVLSLTPGTWPSQYFYKSDSILLAARWTEYSSQMDTSEEAIPCKTKGQDLERHLELTCLGSFGGVVISCATNVRLSMPSPACCACGTLSVAALAAVAARVLRRGGAQEDTRYSIVAVAEDELDEEYIDIADEGEDEPVDNLSPLPMPQLVSTASGSAAPTRDSWVAEMNRELAEFDSLVDATPTHATPPGAATGRPSGPGTWQHSLEDELARHLDPPTPADSQQRLI
jgi:hypothetical protein